jgi:enoyl-CoA hydratase
MTDIVRYEVEGGVATISMDDGKANALSPTMFAALGEAFDRAEADDAVLVLAGRPGIFSGGFDLKVLQAGGPEGQAMLRSGFLLAERMLRFPAPVVVACTGHAIAMGLFLVQSADYRIGADGEFRVTANEVAIGLSLPQAAIELLRLRVTPSHLQRAANLAEVYSPAAATDAGLLDVVVAPDAVIESAQEKARELATLDRSAHVSTKLRLRRQTLDALRAATDRDFPE